MNSLNSILMEGVVVKAKRTNALLAFSIKSHRDSRIADVPGTDNIFNVRVFNELADRCEKHLTVGRGVRVIGRLDCENVIIDEKVSSFVDTFILAEHVEIKQWSNEEI